MIWMNMGKDVYISSNLILAERFLCQMGKSVCIIERVGS